MKRMEIDDLVSLFKALSDKTRLRIMYLLATSQTGVCVCEIMDALSENQYNVSRHLKVLKSVGLVQEKRLGRWASYALAKPENQLQRLCIAIVSNLPKELFALDALRLEKRLSLRVNGKCVIGVKSPEWQKIVAQLSREGGNRLC